MAAARCAVLPAEGRALVTCGVDPVTPAQPGLIPVDDLSHD